MNNQFIFQEFSKNKYHYLDFIFLFTNYPYNSSPEIYFSNHGLKLFIKIRWMKK